MKSRYRTVYTPIKVRNRKNNGDMFSPIKRQRKTPTSDRFIPLRNEEHQQIASYKMLSDLGPKDVYCKKEEEYYDQLQNALFPVIEDIRKTRILNFTKGGIRKRKTRSIRMFVSPRKESTKKRFIPQTAERIFDAPGLVDDFYLNLLDWSKTNTLAVALRNVVFLWNESSGVVTEIPVIPDEHHNDYVSSISWMDDGNHIAIGTSQNEIHLWDIELMKKVRTMGGHSARVCSLSWNNYILSSGGQEGLIIHHDVRVARHIASKCQGHRSQVCGLKWSDDGKQLASGGNDNLLRIWSINEYSRPIFTFDEHKSAVRALAWCPWERNLLASGGGNADQKLRFWNTLEGTCTSFVDTKSQVCSILWSKYDRELVTSHGFVNNQLVVWKYPSLTKIAELTGHSSRVLHMAHNPDFSLVVSAAGDETLRFWRIFTPLSEKKRRRQSSRFCVKIR